MKTVNRYTESINMFWGFYISAFFYYLIIILNSWGSPNWYGSLTLSTQYKFLNALKIYSLSCLFYFLARYLFYLKGFDLFNKKITFIISFIPCILFSVLVILNNPINILENLTIIVSMFFWLIIVILANIIGRNTIKVTTNNYVKQWLLGLQLFGIIHLVVFTVNMIKLLPGNISSLLGLIPFVLFFSYSLSKGFPWSDSKNNNQIDKLIKFYEISPREKDVLLLLTKGKTNDEISEELCISLSTVKTHIRKIFDKTNSRNRVEVNNLFNSLDQPKV